MQTCCINFLMRNRKLILVVNNETANTEEEPKMNHKMQHLVTP